MKLATSISATRAARTSDSSPSRNRAVASAARLVGAPLPVATLPELEAAYRAAMAPDSLSSAVLEAPEGLDWDRTP